MTRPPRVVRPQAQELEGRLLLTALPVATARPEPTTYYSVQFGDDPAPGPDTSPATQVVSQQASMATLMLSRTLTKVVRGDPIEMGGVGVNRRPLEVEVKTDPSPGVGVNVGAVDQTVTFARGQGQAAVRIPILTGAANPGEVDVTLTATPINAPTTATSSGSLVLRIMASDASVPPAVTAEQDTPHGIVLAFNKPMNPAAASNVNNYTVTKTFTSWTENGIESFIDSITIPLHMDSSLFPSRTSTQKVPLRAAEYDPATNSVTLVPKHRLTYGPQISANPDSDSGTATTSGPARPSASPLGPTDLEGNPISGG